jgi:hypothetical protein
MTSPVMSEFLGFSTPDWRLERLSPKSVLAEGEELWSNLLFV